MKLFIYDHGGYAFITQLCKELARRGHEVLHSHCISFHGPNGIIERKHNDPPAYKVCPIRLSKPFNRYGMVSRVLQERELGGLISKRVNEFSPDMVISANTPLVSQAALLKTCRVRNIPFVFWIQDLLGIGVKHNLLKKNWILGQIVGRYFIALERGLLRKSDRVIAISDDFVPAVIDSGISESRIHVIPNWAPVNELPLLERCNPWAELKGLSDKFCFLYSGTLGMKHNPEILVRLAEKYRHDEKVRIVVITEGLGGDYLKEKCRATGLNNLLVLPFQPAELLPQILATADVLIAILESDADVFSVPSKVMTYLCMKRPLLLSVPPKNLAARIVEENNAGLVNHPEDFGGFISAAEKLFLDGGLRWEMAQNGRKYAEKNFDIEAITDQFEEIMAVRAKL